MIQKLVKGGGMLVEIEEKKRDGMSSKIFEKTMSMNGIKTSPLISGFLLKKIRTVMYCK